MPKKTICLTLILFLLSSVTVFAANFFHPAEFTGTEADKKQVLAFIEQDVKERYSKIGMGDPSTLRMMEKNELDAFKQLTKVTNRELLDNVIKQYCNIGMCNYDTILMMFNEQNKAANEKLSW